MGNRLLSTLVATTALMALAGVADAKTVARLREGKWNEDGGDQHRKQSIPDVIHDFLLFRRRAG